MLLHPIEAAYVAGAQQAELERQLARAVLLQEARQAAAAQRHGILQGRVVRWLEGLLRGKEMAQACCTLTPASAPAACCTH